MTDEEFEEIVREGIKNIPKKFLEKLENVDVVIEDEPTLYQLKELKIKGNSLIFGLYEGVPQTQRSNYGQVLPDKITIFKKSIEKVACSEEEIKKIVRDTVWHEIAHHFGIKEERVRFLESKRKKDNKNTAG